MSFIVNILHTEPDLPPPHAKESPASAATTDSVAESRKRRWEGLNQVLDRAMHARIRDQYLTASHEALKDLPFETTATASDSLSQIMQSQPGGIGSRIYTHLFWLIIVFPLNSR
jgi:hypothetical protein